MALLARRPRSPTTPTTSRPPSSARCARTSRRCSTRPATAGGSSASRPGRRRAALGLLERTRLSPVYGRLLHKLLADSYVSTDKARDRLGFAPRLSNQDAILRTFDWWRAHEGSTGRRPPAGRTSREPWRQGLLGLVKILF